MFDIDTGLIFWTALSFGFLLFLLYKLVFPPIHKVLDQRRDAIEGKIEEAKQAQTEAENLLSKYKTQMIEAEKRTSEMFEDARHKSEAFREDTLLSAQKESRNIIENAKEDIDIFKRKALVGLKVDISKIVADVARKLIRKKLSAKDQLKLVESSIKELEKNAKDKV